MANPQNTNPNARTNQSSQGSQQNTSSQSSQQNAGTQGQWSNQDLYGNQDFGGYGAGFGGQGMSMYDPNIWGMGNMAGGPYSGPNQGYGANWYGAPQYAGLGPLGYPMGGYGNQGFGGYGPGMGLGTPQYAGLGGWGVPATATITGWWLIPGPATGMGPQNAQRSDQRIEEDVCDRLTAHGHLDARHVDVKVNNGEVTLSGTVDSRQDKREAEHVADSVQGIKDVHNQLKVQPQQGQSQQGQQSQTQQQQQAKTH